MEDERRKKEGEGRKKKVEIWSMKEGRRKKKDEQRKKREERREKKEERRKKREERGKKKEESGRAFLFHSTSENKLEGCYNGPPGSTFIQCRVTGCVMQSFSPCPEFIYAE